MTTAPNMATITESLERSLQNCSLNHERRTTHHIIGGGRTDGGTPATAAGEEGLLRRSSSSSSTSHDNNNTITSSDTSLELNSHLSLPYHWEQCLDLKTGEIYYINWMNGMKAMEDPRTTAEYSGDFYSEDEEDDEDEDEDSLYDSEESQSETSSCSTRGVVGPGDCNKNNNHHRVEKEKDNVLVVAGCKSCLMYVMVPKQVEDCPKCNGQLLHFDRSEETSYP